MWEKGINNSSHYFVKILLTIAFGVLFFQNPISAQQIITDGKTNTHLNINGNKTTITTDTIKSKGAFNSFSKFNVYQNNTVNLIVPSQASFLMNLIHSGITNIDGTLNSIKNGAIGGNVFLVNPQGIIIGARGVINVGSLTAITPTPEFMNTIFNSPGDINNSSVNALLNDTASINSNAIFQNDGLINAATDVKIDTGCFNNSGEINTGSVFQTEKPLSLSEVDPGEVVNINTVDSPTSFAVNSGELNVKSAVDITNSGHLNANGGNNVNAGNIKLTANRDIFLESNSEINAIGRGNNSNGGAIYAYANNDLVFKSGAKVDASAGNILGNGGSIELSSTNKLTLSGEMKAKSYNGTPGSIFIDPAILEITDDIISDGANITLEATEYILVYPGVFISSRNINNPIVQAHLTALSEGNSGSIKIKTPAFGLSEDSKILSFANNGFKSGDITIIADLIDMNYDGNTLNAGSGDITMSRYTAGDIYITDFHLDFITEYEEYYLNTSTPGRIIANNLNIGNASNTNNLTQNIYVYSNLNGKNINLSAANNISGSGPATINTTGNINLTALKGDIGKLSKYLFINEGSNSTINATAQGNIHLKEIFGDMRIKQIISTGNGDIYLAVANGSVLNANTSGDYNVIGHDLIIKNDIGKYYFIGIFDDPFYENPEYNTIDLYLDTFLDLGENWKSMPESNFITFNTNDGALNKSEILNAFKTVSEKLEPNDVLVIIYDGHGGYYSGPDFDPIDESNGIALNTVDEYMAFNEGFAIYDDEFADSLKNTNGNIVFITEQCFGGGMFGGDADLDQIAKKEDFNYYGITGTKEGYVGWAFSYSKLNNTRAGLIDQALLNTLLDENPNLFGNPLGNPYNSDGNVTLTSWYNAIKMPEPFILYDTTNWFLDFTNMSEKYTLNIPIITTSGFNYPKNIGQAHNPLRVNLTGDLTAYSQNLISISGNWQGEDLQSDTNNIIINGFPLQALAPTQRDLAVVQDDYSLDKEYEDKVFEMVTFPTFDYFKENEVLSANEDNKVYLDIAYENYTKNMLNSVVESYSTAYKTTASEDQALAIAAKMMVNAQFTPEIVAKLIKRKSFNNEPQMVKIMEYFINNNALKLSNKS